MSQQYWFGFLVLLTCCFLEASTRPSNNESETPVKVETTIKELLEQIQDAEQRSLPYDRVRYTEITDENTKEILEKIKAINNGLKKPNRHQINYNNAQPHTGGAYVLDKETLEKIQQIIASGKLHGLSVTQNHDDTNSLINDDFESRYDNSRALQYIQPALTSNALTVNQRAAPAAVMPIPYITNMPVMVMPTMNGLYGGYSMSNDVNSLQPTTYQTRQRPPSLPFQIQWPLAPIFPILIKDPLLHYFSTGSFDNLFEYGQNADVCNRHQKSAGEDNNTEVAENTVEKGSDDKVLGELITASKSRQGRAIKKRTVSKSAPAQDIHVNDIKKVKKFFAKPVTTPVPVKKTETVQNIKSTDPSDGDLRFPFGDFTWFGNRKPVAPSPGFFINRLKVRRGGVAIAGPGGVATAGRGGTAVVGPGGLAYTQPGGLAVAGPAARVVALSSGVDLSSIVSRLQEQAATDDTTDDYKDTEEYQDGEDGETTEERALGSAGDQTNTNIKVTTI